MKHEQTLTPVPVETETNTPASCGFRCPYCVMADTCGQCNRLDTQGYCSVHHCYRDPQSWCCPFYYEN